jgi:hypothetical protein
MSNEEILTQAVNFIDDSPDRVLLLQLVNDAKDELEAELKMEITKKLDTSLTSSVGGTYLTSYSLAGIDYFELYEQIYVGTTPRSRIPFDRRLEFKDDSSKFYVNLAANTLHLCGTVASAETITIPYVYNTPAITDDTTTVVVWPPRFHILIPMHIAIMHPAIEGGDKARAWDDRWQAFYTRKKNALIDWDHSHKLAAIGGATPYGDESTGNSSNQLNI